jgi:hypothetical protein
MNDDDRLAHVSKEKLEELGIRNNKYEITLKFTEEDIYVIAAALSLAPGFGYKDPAEFLKFVIHKFNVTVAEAAFNTGTGETGKKETFH